MQITLLSPTWKKATTAKKFTLDCDKKVKLASSYNLGERFIYKKVNVKSISGLFSILDTCKDKKVIRIYGEPADHLPVEVNRLKVNFQITAHQLLMIDADKWPIPKQFRISTPESIVSIVRHMLIDVFGYKVFEKVSFVALLSSSTWKTTVLSAHIYFIMDGILPLADMAMWATSHTANFQEYKIDRSVYRDVQPDFISKRECVGFKDPLPDSIRLTQYKGEEDQLNAVDFSELIRTCVEKAEKIIGVSPNSTSNERLTNSLVNLPIGKNWVDTLKLCGSAVHGINEPAYRACAQLVQEIGELSVSNSLDSYVKKVYDLMWESIKNHGVRGDKADRDLYTLPKVKNYLSTALNKEFGKDADATYLKIKKVLDRALSGESAALLFDRDIAEAIFVLKRDDRAKFNMLRNEVKTGLRGRIAMKEFDDMAKGEAQQFDTAQKLEEVLASLEWVRASNTGSFYCKVKRAEAYSLIPLGGGVEKYIFEAAISKGFETYRGMEADAVKLLMARQSDPMFNPFRDSLVETRSYTKDSMNGYTTFYNLGISADGYMQTAVIDRKGVEIVPSSSVPVMWHISPKLGYASLEDEDDMKDILGSESRDQLVKDFVSNMREFINVDSDMGLYDLISWLVMATMNAGTACMLELIGPSGSGKTTMAILLKNLCDPGGSDIKRTSEVHNTFYKKDELAKTLASSQITIFDNFSNLKPEDQNTLCTICTGWTWEERILYTQERATYRIKRPVIFTSLTNLATHQDLRSRTITLVVSDVHRSLSIDVYEEWEKKAASLRYGLLNLVSKTIELIYNMKKSGRSINSRTLITDAAKMILLKLDPVYTNKSDIKLMQVIDSRRLDRDAEEAITNSTTNRLVIWVMYSKLFRGLTKTEVPSGVLYDNFRIFVNENAGRKFRVQGDVVVLENLDHTDKPRMFSKNLSTYVHDLFAATGWKIRRPRNSKGRTWAFTLDLNRVATLQRMYPGTPDPRDALKPGNKIYIS